MTIVRWEQFRDLVGLQDRMNRLFGEAYRGSARAGEEDWALGGSWAPAVDIFEKDGNIVLKAELPGIASKERRHPGREQRPHPPGRAQVRRGAAEGELPSRGAGLRRVHPVVHAVRPSSTPRRSRPSSRTAC